MEDCALHTWIHGDERSARPDQVNLPPLEYEPLFVCGQGAENGEDLLGDHGQHLDVDSVELVETAPRSGLRNKEEGRKCFI